MLLMYEKYPRLGGVVTNLSIANNQRNELIAAYFTELKSFFEFVECID